VGRVAGGEGGRRGEEVEARADPARSGMLTAKFGNVGTGRADRLGRPVRLVCLVVVRVGLDLI